ncbi:hypothetical protein LSCM1_07671 [Leishmania martiniquensis]|uniref:Uncharacterized protein n=1 Tax=Leishmania martiniquensis TaxID=1580590 RepID=A0A836HG70_9TRYP|nr:hypothetical protein LSCM1_07671 [Leishmania martiniquensis]
MVLLFSVEKPARKDEGRRDEKVEARDEEPYVWSTFEDRIAVIYEDQKGARPSAEEIESQLRAARYPLTPCFFATPFDGLIDGSDEEESTALHRVFENIAQCAQRRESITLVHRGVNAEAHLESTLIAFLQAVRSSAEYGIQVVADEIAKEKQMQRLLQMNLNPIDTGAAEARGTKGHDPDATKQAGGGVPLSKELLRKIATLRQEYHYVHPADRRATAANRYGLITAAHDDLLQPPHSDSTSLVPEAFAAHPLASRTSRKSTVTSLMAVKNARSHSVLFSQMARRNTALLLSELRQQETDLGCEPIPGNGWGDKITLFTFDGVSSVMALPGIPNFEEVIRELVLDFWVRTDLKPVDGKRVLVQIMEGQREDVGQLFQLSLNWYEDMPDSLRVVIRDSANRVLEAVASVAKEGLTDGATFHHLMLRIHSLEEGQLSCEVDGRPIDIQLIQQEHPVAFNPWPHRLFVGGYLDEANSPALVFRGTIAELRFWSGGSPSYPIVRWPLFAVESGTLQEMTRTIPADHHETLLNLRAVEEPPPRCAPSFDGSLVMNVGTVPLFGQLMHNFRMELCFRTNVSSRMMTLVGVTDRSFRMQEFGIVLNSEPVITKERLRYHELHATFYIVDAFGACCSALLRGTERHNLMDGEWHKLVWRCIDSEANKFTVKVDDVLQDLLFVSREGPTRFVSFNDWVAVGGHNVRNWKIKRHFTGQIAHFYLSLRGCPYVTLKMDEGPGAYVLQDHSHHHNHGLLIDSTTGVVRRNDVVWVPGPAQKSDDLEEAVWRDVRTFKNNDVSVAAVVFTCTAGEQGFAREALYDVLSGTCREPERTPHILAEQAEAQWNCWYGLPAQCYHSVDSLTRLEESINRVLKADAPRGHLLVTVRIGNCLASVLHIREPELPADAVYDCNMLKWHYPYMVEGTRGWRELMLNRMIEGAESVLLRDTLKPYVTAKLGPLNSGPTSLLTEDIIRSLQRSGRPWFLPVVLHTHLLNAEFGSTLHVIQRIRPRMSANEAAAICLFSKKLFDGVRENASLVIQRNWRGCLAKREAMQRSEQRSLDDRKVEEIRTLRMNALCKAKGSLCALLITLHHPRSPVPAIDSDTKPLEDALRKQGYEVSTLQDPDMATMLRALSQTDTTKSNFIYLSGYGGALNLRQPPVFGFEALAVYIEEQAYRATLECDEGRTFRELMARMKEEEAMVPVKKPKKKPKKAAGAAASARQKKKTAAELELEQRHLESALQANRLEMEQKESSARDSLVRECEATYQLLSRELRHAIVITREYEERYRAKGPDGDVQNFVYPCESRMIEPFATTVVNVEDVIRAALHRQAPPPGLQSVVAIDLQPVTPYSCGVAYLASSTGNMFRVPYRPEQRELLSWILVKAFEGHLRKISATSKYAVLSGGIETAANERDWKSFASYVVRKLQVYCSPERCRMLRGELDRQVPFVAELVPVRDIVMDAEAKDRRRRERETQKVKATVTFGVGSAKVQSDMFSLLRDFLEGITVSELVFTNTIHILFTQHNKGVDGIHVKDVTDALEKCRPAACNVAFEMRMTASGVEVQFKVSDAGDRLPLSQWLNALSVRTLTWQFRQRPLFGTAPLEVDYLEYQYDAKITCSLRRYRQLCKQFHAFPVPKPYVRILRVRVGRSAKQN